MEKADFMAGQLRVRIYPDEYTMGATAARETADRICRLLEESRKSMSFLPPPLPKSPSCTA